MCTIQGVGGQALPSYTCTVPFPVLHPSPTVTSAPMSPSPISDHSLFHPNSHPTLTYTSTCLNTQTTTLPTLSRRLGLASTCKKKKWQQCTPNLYFTKCWGGVSALVWLPVQYLMLWPILLQYCTASYAVASSQPLLNIHTAIKSFSAAITFCTTPPSL